MEAEKIYIKRVHRYKKLIEKQNKWISFLSNLRLIIFIVGIASCCIMYFYKKYYLSISLLLVFLVIFIFIALIHSNVIKNRKLANIICSINEDSIKRMEFKWMDFQDTGAEFVDDKHNFSSDLDIFGKNSLFQYINSCETYYGRLNLKEKLSKPSKNIEEIKFKQEAILELSKKISFRQRLKAEAIYEAPEKISLDTIFNWGTNFSAKYSKPLYFILINILTLLAVISTILPFINKNVPFYIPFIMYFINALFLLPNSSDKTEILKNLESCKKNIATYSAMLKLIEKTKFKSIYFKKYDLYSSSKQINKLVHISEMIAIRNSSIYLFINILLLWDYRCLRAVEKWQSTSGNKLSHWVEALSEIEALSSLSNIAFEQKQWTFPDFFETKQGLDALNLGHPLLSSKRISNNVHIGDTSSILLITGSNMSGKSTFLRTIGINLVLAYAGAPVCATSFKTSIMDICTCMRTSDNLEENISSFYAELLRIKLIVSAANSGDKILFLLDEIFKGTNSLDRHTGAKVLIRQLAALNATGLISTHDLELGDLEKEAETKVKNYHFREFYDNNKIYFDYKLRPGISTTRNAMYLIKLVGLDALSVNE